MLDGIDISSYQKDIDWNKVAAAGKKFCICRSSIGLSEDGSFADHSYRARLAGLSVGAYHFCYPNMSALKQAALFAEQCNGMDLPPCVDLESIQGLGPDAYLAWVETFVSQLEMLTERRCAIYTGAWFWNKLSKSPGFASSIAHQRPLWVSQYTTAASPTLPQGWTEWAMWQHLADPSPNFPHAGRCDGIPGNCDLNRFNGSDEEFAAWCSP